jgi:hypothetical protein
VQYILIPERKNFLCHFLCDVIDGKRASKKGYCDGIPTDATLTDVSGICQ